MSGSNTDRLAEMAAEIERRLAGNEDARLCVVCGERLDDQDEYDWSCYDCDPHYAEGRLEDAEREMDKIRLRIVNLTVVLEQYEAKAALAREMLRSDDLRERMALAAVWVASNGKPRWPSEEEWPLE